MFFYQDTPRLQLFFSSPNLCGCFCAMLLALCVGAWLMALKRNRPWLAGVIGAAGALWAFLLAATYSRGGLIAALCAVLAIFLHSRKWIALCWLAVAVIAFASVGGGGDRIASLGDAASDGSIRNRVFLWRGACGIIAASPWRGVENPGAEYHAWRQPLWIDASYRTMISDALTLGAMHGLWAVGLYFLPLAILLALPGRAPTESPWAHEALTACIGAIVSYYAAALFSTMYEHQILLGGLTALFAVAYALEGWILWRLRQWPGWRRIAAASSATAAICLALYAAGRLENAMLSCDWQWRDMRADSGATLKILSCRPRAAPKARVILLTTCDDDAPDWSILWPETIRGIIRPLALAQYEIVAAAVDSGYDGKAHAEAMLRRFGNCGKRPQCVIAVGTGGGKNALLALANPEIGGKFRKAALINVPQDWPFAGLSPREAADGYHGAMLLISCDGHTRDDAEALASIRRDGTGPTQCIVFDSARYPGHSLTLAGRLAIAFIDTP